MRRFRMLVLLFLMRGRSLRGLFAVAGDGGGGSEGQLRWLFGDAGVNVAAGTCASTSLRAAVSACPPSIPSLTQ